MAENDSTATLTTDIISPDDPKRPLQIVSTDINVSKLNLELVAAIRVAVPHVDDTTLARFYFARNGDVTKIVPMLLAYYVFRKANYPIFKSNIAAELEKGMLYWNGYDKEGHPLVVFNVSKLKPKERDIAELTRVLLWWIEVVTKALPADKSKFTLLFSRVNHTSENTDIEFMRHAAKVLSDNFPERLYRAIVYPSGWIFYGVWNIVKYFLDPVTQDKIRPVMDLANVQELIPDEFIPVEMGGSSTYVYNYNEFDDPYVKEEEAAAAISDESHLDV